MKALSVIGVLIAAIVGIFLFCIYNAWVLLPAIALFFGWIAVGFM
jgi:hypothetical protein